MVSIRTRQLEDLSDLTSHVDDGDATVDNSDYTTLPILTPQPAETELRDRSAQLHQQR